MTPVSPALFPSQYSCVFFDFDGVIADSVDAKIGAFGELYAGFGHDVRQAVEDYQRAVPGETRFEKIPRFHKQLLDVDLSPAEIQQWSDRLSEIVMEQVIKSPILPDVHDILAMLVRLNIPAHIVSGTPQDELEIIVQRKGLAPFFQTLRGSPESKSSIVRSILARDGHAPARCLFIGDAMSDYDCAKTCGLDFLGRADTARHPFPEGTMVAEKLGDYFFAEDRPEPRPASPETFELKREAK